MTHLAHVHESWLAAGIRRLTRAANAWRVSRGLERLFDNVETSPAESQEVGRSPFELSIAVAVPAIQPRCDAADELAVEALTIARAQRDASAIVSEYVHRFGWLFNADNMSELLDVHTDARRWAWHDAVRSSASGLTQAAFDAAVGSTADEDHSVVLFTGGGNGSGKSTFAGDGLHGCFGLDSTLSDFDSSRRNIDKVLASGRAVAVTFIYRQPDDAYLYGVMPRAADPNNGRPVPLATHCRTHAKAPVTADALARTYKREPALRIAVVENRTGELPRLRSMEWLRSRGPAERDESAIRRRIAELLETR